MAYYPDTREEERFLEYEFGQHPYTVHLGARNELTYFCRNCEFEMVSRPELFAHHKRNHGSGGFGGSRYQDSGYGPSRGYDDHRSSSRHEPYPSRGRRQYDDRSYDYPPRNDFRGRGYNDGYSRSNDRGNGFHSRFHDRHDSQPPYGREQDHRHPYNERPRTYDDYPPAPQRVSPLPPQNDRNPPPQNDRNPPPENDWNQPPTPQNHRNPPPISAAPPPPVISEEYENDYDDVRKRILMVEQEELVAEFGDFISITLDSVQDIYLLRCDICKLTVTSGQNMRDHCKGKKHTKQKTMWDQKKELAEKEPERIKPDKSPTPEKKEQPETSEDLTPAGIINKEIEKAEVVSRQDVRVALETVSSFLNSLVSYYDGNDDSRKSKSMKTALKLTENLSRKW